MLRPLYHTMRFLVKGSVNSLRNRMSPPVVVLIYHRVTELARDPQLLAVSPDRFRKHLEILKQFPILRFEDDWSHVGEPSVAVTFDDGYADNLHEALPILEEFDVPATVFVTAGAVGSRSEFWWDELERLVLEAPSLPNRLRLEASFIPKPAEWAIQTAEDRSRLYSSLHSLIARTPDASFCSRLLADLRRWAGEGEEGRDAYRPLNHTELRALAENPLVTIGAHGMTHLPFSVLSPEMQQQEIVSSKRVLESELGRTIEVFSYPFGRRRDYSASTVQLVREAGFTRAAANFPGQWRRSSDPFQIPRQVVRNWSPHEFATNLKKFWVL